MPSPEAMRRLSAVTIFVLPLVAVKIAGVVMGGSAPAAGVAANADAAAQPVADAAGNSASVQWTTQQQAAAEHLRQVSQRPFGPAPMLYVAVEAQAEPAQPVEMPEPVVVLPEIPDFALQAIMTAAAGDKALINGRTYVLGQDVHGWRVERIDADARSVTLREINGDRTVTLSVRLPD